MSKRKTTSAEGATVWYLEPIGKTTNRDLFRYLSGRECLEGVMCADGKRHNLLEATYSEVSFADKSRKDGELNFLIWCKCVKTGEIIKWQEDRPRASRRVRKKVNLKLRRSITNGKGESVRFPRRIDG